MLKLSGFSEVIAAVGRGRDIAVSAYTLSGSLMREIESRAQNGARVTVTLEEDPAGNDSTQLRRNNAAVVAALRAEGVDARLERNVHCKTVTVDGSVFFDGSNWRCGDVVVRDDTADAAHIASVKSAALKEEAAMLDGARLQRTANAIVETETFDRYNVVSKELRELAAAHLSPRLLVDERALRHNSKEAANLAKMVAEGVEVRVCDDTEKFALAGSEVWLGSANATAAFAGRDMTDWGAVSKNPAIRAAVRDRVEARWTRAREFQMLPVV